MVRRARDAHPCAAVPQRQHGEDDADRVSRRRVLDRVSDRGVRVARAEHDEKRHRQRLLGRHAVRNGDAHRQRGERLHGNAHHRHRGLAHWPAGQFSG